jgi:hypothetical protein
LAVRFFFSFFVGWKLGRILLKSIHEQEKKIGGRKRQVIDSAKHETRTEIASDSERRYVKWKSKRTLRNEKITAGVRGNRTRIFFLFLNHARME